MAKILVYSTQLIETGGIENHILEFCEKMHSVGIEIDIIVPIFRMQERDKRRLDRYCSNIYVFYSKEKILSLIWLTLILLKLRHKKYDSLYTNGQGDSVFVVGQLVRSDNWIHHHHSSGGETDQKTWGKKYTVALKKATKVIACSQRNANNMKNVLDREINSIPCFSRNIGKSISHPLGQREMLNFAYYGRLINGKGIEMICKLSNDKDCTNIQFNLWGMGETFTSTFFRQYPNVLFHGGFYTKEELVKIISLIDGFLLLSDSEGLPISLLEVMSAGVPWIATNVGGIPDIFCSSESTKIISNPHNYEEVKAEVLKLADDIRKGKVSREPLMKFYEDMFSAENLINRWKHVLKI